MVPDLGELRKRLGLGEESADHLKTAVTHRSYAVENNLGYDNQRLEFLGDAVLEIILTEHLFRLYPDSDEGELTKIRSALVREAALAKLARRLQLGQLAVGGAGANARRGGRIATPRWPICLKRCWGPVISRRGSTTCASLWRSWWRSFTPIRDSCSSR